MRSEEKRKENFFDAPFDVKNSNDMILNSNILNYEDDFELLIVFGIHQIWIDFKSIKNKSFYLSDDRK